MTCGVEAPLEFCRGKTMSKVFRWGQSRKIYRPIVAATQAAPCVLEVTGHDMPDGWAYQINNAKGMTQLNTKATEYLQAIVIDNDHLELNHLDATPFPAYSGGGILSYNQPVDLTGYTARLQVRKAVNSPAVELELTTENGGIIIDLVKYTITLYVTDEQTEAFTFQEGVYDLEMESAGGEVYQLAYGAVTEEQEVTR